MTAKHIKIFLDFDESTAALTDTEIGRLVKGMVQYAKDGKKPVFKGNERLLFPVFKAQIDREKDIYSEKAKKLSENGKKGGRPKKAKESNCFLEKPNESKKSQEYIYNNTTTTTTDILLTNACAREENAENPEAVQNSVQKSPPSFMEICSYFKDELCIAEAAIESELFEAYNAKRGWDCLPDWKSTADLWGARKRQRESVIHYG